MKKLKLKTLELGTTEVLTRSQLKNVLGGDGSGSSAGSGCTDSCTGNTCDDGRKCISVIFANGHSCKRCVTPGRAIL